MMGTDVRRYLPLLGLSVGLLIAWLLLSRLTTRAKATRAARQTELDALLDLSQ